MKQYFKIPIKTISCVRLGLPLGCLAFVAGALTLISCTEGGRSNSPSARVGNDPRKLEMQIPMSAPVGHPLINLTDEIPTLKIDLRYARRDNVSRQRLYQDSMPAMLDAPTTKKLAKAQSTLLDQGYGLKVWDAYRPPTAHLRLWKLSGRSGYVADPRWGWSKHCSGRAVDVTLVDQKTGEELSMPSKFDDFTEKAASAYTGPSEEIAERVKILRGAMLGAGFVGIDMEWWHFENSERFRDNLPPVYADEAGVELP